jgi:hypothetical protein
MEEERRKAENMTNIRDRSINKFYAGMSFITPHYNNRARSVRPSSLFST